MLPGRVLDIGALVDIAVAKTRHSRTITTACLLLGGEICVPATALSAVYSIAPLNTQVELFELLSTRGVSVDDFTAGKVGDIAEILDGSSDVVAGHVIWCAREKRWPILTDRGDKLKTFDPYLLIDDLP
jgi:hypothetical protein